MKLIKKMKSDIEKAKQFALKKGFNETYDASFTFIARLYK